MSPSATDEGCPNILRGVDEYSPETVVSVIKLLHQCVPAALPLRMMVISLNRIHLGVAIRTNNLRSCSLEPTGARPRSCRPPWVLAIDEDIVASAGLVRLPCGGDLEYGGGKLDGDAKLVVEGYAGLFVEDIGEGGVVGLQGEGGWELVDKKTSVKVVVLCETNV